MIKKLFSFCLILCLLTPVIAKEHAYKVEDIPMVHLQNRKRYVSNPDGILSSSAVSQIDQILYNLEQTTSIQTLVVAVKQIEEGDCFNFAYELGRRNGVGQKGKDNGLIILLVTEARCIRFATGYGLEGDLPDAVCKQIQERYMNKAFAQDDWDKGMLEGIKAVSRQLEGTGEPFTQQAKHRSQEDTDQTLLIAILVCCFLIVPLFVWFNIYQRRRCPQCHKHTLKQLSTRTVAYHNDLRTEEVVLRCSNCGHIKRQQRKKRNHDDDSHRHPGSTGAPFIGGPFMGGGHSSGGFDGGGSFDGGDFGGGGAESNF